MSVAFEGVFGPVLLALDAGEEVDETGLRREARLLVEAGLDGLLVNGATSEGAMVSAEESGCICRAVVDEVAGRVPVISGVIADSTREAVHLGRIAREAGAAALLVPPVHFLNLPPRRGVNGFYRTLADEIDLPIVVYNVVPWLNLPPDHLLELAEIPQVVAIKQSNENFHELADLLRRADGRLAVLTAIEDLIFPALALGAPGMMVAIAALLPDLCVELYQAVRAGETTAARSLHERILPVVRAVYLDENFPATVKAGLALRGRSVGGPRSPLEPCPPERIERIRASLVEAGVTVTEESEPARR